METVIAEIDFIPAKLIFLNSDGTQTCILRANIVSKEDGSDIVDSKMNFKGEYCPGRMNIGQTYRFHGELKKTKYGLQFHYESFCRTAPLTKQGTIKYLEQFRGIGSSVANRIWDALGEHCLRILRENPEDASEAVPRLRINIAQQVSEDMKLRRQMEVAEVQLHEMFSGRGFPRSLISQLIFEYGLSAPELVAENPFMLCEIRGCSFAMCDQLFLDLGKHPADIVRQAYYLWDKKFRLRDGSTWSELTELYGGMPSHFGQDIDLHVEDAIEFAIGESLLCRNTVKKNWFTFPDWDSQEQGCADMISMRILESQKPSFVGLLDPDESPLTDHQIEATQQVMGADIGCLVGSPGVGKTFTIAEICRQVHGSKKICLLAPYGKAATRITQQMQSAGVDLVASTIHRRLIPCGPLHLHQFIFNQRCPMDEDLIVVDESSTLDLPLFHALLSAVKPSAQILFVGDPGQLWPIGHGKPLMDMLKAKVPTGELSEIHRNAGRVAHACKQIKEGRPVECSPEINLAEGENLLLTGCSGGEKQSGYVSRFYFDLLKDTPEGIDPVWDVMVLSPLNEHGPVSRKSMNDVIKAILNPTEVTEQQPFGVEDKVTLLENDWYACKWIDDILADAVSIEEYHRWQKAVFSDGEVIIFNDTMQVLASNGELGTIMARNVGEGWLMKIKDSRREILVTKRNQIDLAYCLSVHKAQGSEAPIVIFNVDSCHKASRLMTKNLVYTALSRTQRECHVNGTVSALRRACAREHETRNTFLSEQVLRLCNKNREVRIEDLF